MGAHFKAWVIVAPSGKAEQHTIRHTREQSIRDFAGGGTRDRRREWQRWWKAQYRKGYRCRRVPVGHA